MPQGDGFEASLGFVPVVERAFQAGNRERRVRRAKVFSDPVERAGQFGAGGLNLKDEIAKILVV